MLDIPKTIEEAKKYRYGTWAGVPNGYSYNPTHCAFEVWNGPRGMTANQCSRKNGYGPSGLFCKIHAKKIDR